MRKQSLTFFFILGLLVSHQRTQPMFDKTAAAIGVAAGVAAGCLGLYGLNKLYNLYNHFYDFTLKDAKELLENIEALERTSASIATADINYATWAPVSEPRVHHVIKLRSAMLRCKDYTERIHYGLPFLEKKAAEKQDYCHYEITINAMREKIDELAILKVKLQEIVTQIEQTPGYEQEYSRYGLKELKEQTAGFERRLWSVEKDICELKGKVQQLEYNSLQNKTKIST